MAMNKYIKTILASVFALLALGSCVREQPLIPRAGVERFPETRGVMEVEVLEKFGEEETDRIETIRFIVFKDPDVYPRLELNRLFVKEDFNEEQSPGGQEISKLSIILKLSMRIGEPNPKMVAAIVNESPAMTPLLEQVAIPADLAALKLQFSDFFTADHSALAGGLPMPMTDVVWTDQIYETELEAENNRVQMTLERAVAKVVVCLKKSDEPGTENLKLGNGTKITLINTYDSEYFIRHYDSSAHQFGYIQTVPVSELVERAWSLSSVSQEIDAATPVCSFYTPERNCVGCEMQLMFDVVTDEGALRPYTLLLNTAHDDQSQKQPIKAIQRNNIYKVTATIGINGIEAVVENWNSEEITSEL